MTDCGTKFLGKVFEEVYKLLNISQTSTTPYHSQSNGSLESSHRTLSDNLRTTPDKMRKTGMCMFLMQCTIIILQYTPPQGFNHMKSCTDIHYQFQIH